MCAHVLSEHGGGVEGGGAARAAVRAHAVVAVAVRAPRRARAQPRPAARARVAPRSLVRHQVAVQLSNKPTLYILF